MAEWSKAQDSSSCGREARVGSNPTGSKIVLFFWQAVNIVEGLALQALDASRNDTAQRRLAPRHSRLTPHPSADWRHVTRAAETATNVFPWFELYM